MLCYSSYGSSEPGGFLIFLGIVFFIFGILQIILFFKVWVMTDNVRELKKHILKEKNDYAKLVMKGDLEEAAKMQIQYTVDSIFSAFIGCEERYASNYEAWEASYTKKYFDEKVSELETKLRAIGRENDMPEALKSFRTCYDIFMSGRV